MSSEFDTDLAAVKKFTLYAQCYNALSATGMGKQVDEKLWLLQAPPLQDDALWKEVL